MANSQFRSRKSVSGRKYVAIRKERSCELAGIPALTNIGEDRLKLKRVRGGNQKKSLLSSNKINVSVNGKTSSLKILSVENNPANINFTRRSIISKGTIVKTDKGTVRVTSRPGQEGILFGVLI